LFIVVLFCAKYKATIISTMGKLRFALVLLQKKVLSDNSDFKNAILFLHDFSG